MIDITMKKVNGTFVVDTIKDARTAKTKRKQSVSKGEVIVKSEKFEDRQCDQLHEFLSGFNLVADVLRRM